MGQRLRGILGLAVLAALLGAGWFGWETWRLNKVRTALTEVVQSTDIDALLRGEDPIPTPSADNPNSQTPPSPSQGGSATGSTPDPDAAPKTSDSSSGVNTGNVSGDASASTPVDLALRNILLSQGEQGLELWRLQANWATLRQESGLVEVREPIVRYALGDPEGERDGKPYFADEQFVNVTARTGRVTDNNSRITLEGDVRSVYQGDVLTGPLAEFNNTDRVLLYPQGATLEGVRMSGFARILRWNMQTNTLEGEQGVSITWIPEPQAAALPEADAAEVAEPNHPPSQPNL